MVKKKKKKTTKETNLPCSSLIRVTNRSELTIKQHTLLRGDTALPSREFILQLSSSLILLLWHLLFFSLAWNRGRA